MEIIISCIALLISFIALWMAVEARQKSDNGVETFARKYVGPLRQEFETGKDRVGELARSFNGLVKGQASTTQEITELRRKITELKQEIKIKNMPQKEPSNGKQIFP